MNASDDKAVELSPQIMFENTETALYVSEVKVGEHLEPRVLHNLGDGDALVRIGREGALEQMPALWGDMARLLKVCGHDAGEHLLQAHQVVAAIVPTLGKWQHACKMQCP